MAELPVSQIAHFSELHPKPDRYKFSYGTAGFRTAADTLDSVLFRVGVIAGLRSKRLDGKTIGVMVTASHNPEHDNGVKLIDPRGEMLEAAWEGYATALANAPSTEEFIDGCNHLVTSLKIDISKPAHVLYARDTRPSGPALVKALEDGINSVGAVGRNEGVQTTPMVHYLVRCVNTKGTSEAYGEDTVEGYYTKMANAFRKLMATKQAPSPLVVDCANGVGYLAIKEFAPYVQDILKFIPINTAIDTQGALNHQAGADYVKTQQRMPPSVAENLKILQRACSFDGDADRLIYYYVDDQRQFRLLDGDKIAALVAGFFADVVKAAGLAGKIEVGIVQTAYANTGSLSLALPESYQTTLFNWLWRRFASLFSHSRLIETPKLNTSERSSLSEIMAVPDKSTNATFANQSSLPKLPIPPLKDTCERYLRALSALQDEREHHATKLAVEDFLARSGPMWDAKLREYAETKDSYIEEFWYESYLSHSDPVVLALNPFFVLEDDPNPARGAQLQRAASLITASLGFVHDLRAGILEPDAVRTTKLDMDQYTRLFGTSRIPTQHGCRMSVTPNSRHIVVLRRGQIYHFDCLDSKNRPIVTEQDILRNLKAIVADADQTPVHEAAKSSVGLLTTENRKIWSQLRQTIHNSSPSNASSLEVIDEALFIVCLDDAAPEDLGELCGNFLCGTYGLSGGVQVGTCTNRWYDKLQIIVCANGAAGINFEHTGVDGHTVLRYAADIFTEGLMLLARSINPKAPVMFKAKLSPHAKASKVKPGPDDVEPEPLDPSPKKLEWELSNTLLTGIRFAETRLSDLICQNDCQALEFTGYGANFIKTHGFSPDAFVQMAFQAAYFGLYGRTECTYEPAMTKAFLHGRTEAIRTVQPSSVNFTRTYFSEAPNKEKIQALRNACVAHSKLTKECSQGLGQDRHLYALYCLVRRELNSAPSSPVSDSGSNKSNQVEMPSIFSDPGWSLLNTSILSTSNCGNPALRLFGFGPVAAEGFGIGYIIKEDGISVCATSKHLQTRRYLDTLSSYLLDVQQLILQIHRAANERAGNFVDHSGVLREAKTGRVIAHLSAQTPAQTPGLGTLELEEEPSTSGYSFFDSVEVQRLARRRPRNTAVGKVLQISEY